MTPPLGCDIFNGPPPAHETYILDHGFWFNPATWRRWLPESAPWPAWLSDRPRAVRWPRITRRDLLTVGNAASDGRSATEVLIGAYVWGNGLPAGPGPARLRMVFDRNPGVVEQRLGYALDTLRGKGPVEAYEQLSSGGSSKLVRLGASFFTKLLYFAGWDSGAGAHRPLILDQHVVIGLNACRGTDWPLDGSLTAGQYAEYLEWAQDKAERWAPGTAADVVERALWECGKKRAG